MVLVGAGVLAGAMNAAAGGGSFVSLPALLFAGVPALSANASSTVALFPGALASTYAFRLDVEPVGGTAVRLLVALSLLGGLFGALLLLFTPQRTFEHLMPWLMLVATLVFAAGTKLGQLLLRARLKFGVRTIAVMQFIFGVYGGYFGGAVGLMMMAPWTVHGATEVRPMIATKTLLVLATNAVAVVCFIAARQVWWPQTGCVLAGALCGGYFGARVARRIPSVQLRAGITVFNVAMTIVFFVRGG
ncbi:MAG: hypothetical protein RLZZ450_4456 [Pseudomonadota bacterium]|jgi:uncharacterized membrane protein YfcA